MQKALDAKHHLHNSKAKQRSFFHGLNMPEPSAPNKTQVKLGRPWGFPISFMAPIKILILVVYKYQVYSPKGWTMPGNREELCFSRKTSSCFGCSICGSAWWPCEKAYGGKVHCSWNRARGALSTNQSASPINIDIESACRRHDEDAATIGSHPWHAHGIAGLGKAFSMSL